jgi:alpha-galactosidase
LGAVTHSDWKVGTEFSGTDSEGDFLRIYGGATITQDVMPHGNVVGDTLLSPKVFVGFFEDWREGMFAFTDACLAEVPRLPMPAGDRDSLLMGWKTGGPSYALAPNTMTVETLQDVSDYVADNIQADGFYNDKGKVHIWVDAGGDSKLGINKMTTFADHCHANGQLAGSYLSPFKEGGAPNKDLTQIATGSYTFQDIILKDGNGDVIIDANRYALDPTHPGTKQLIKDKFDKWKAAGLDYFRMDFTYMGAFEGVHYDTNITTGVQAYNQGMQYLIEQNNTNELYGDIGVGPIFPYQYTHAKRTCNDTHDDIGNTEYQLNSTAYGAWWLNRLVVSDPGSCGFDPAESNSKVYKSRFISSLINGGIVRLENDLTDTNQQTLVEGVVTNAAIMDVARLGACFMPVDFNTGSYAPYSFVHQDGSDFYVAMFNYADGTIAHDVDMARAGLDPSATYDLVNLWDGGTSTASGTLSKSLSSKNAKLFKLTAQEASTRWLDSYFPGRAAFTESTVWGWHADPDGGLQVNLAEFAHGGEPDNGSDDAAIKPQAGMAMNPADDLHYMELTFRRLLGGSETLGNDYTAERVTYTVEYRASLIEGSWLSAADQTELVGSPIPTGDGLTEIVTLRVLPAVETATNGFTRLTLSLSE